MDWLRQILEQTLPFLDRLPLIRALLGSILVLFLPGFAWTLVFFKQIKVVERIALSFGLSIVMVTLVILALNVLFGVSITGLSSLLIIIAITLIPIFLYLFRRLTKRVSNGEGV